LPFGAYRNVGVIMDSTEDRSFTWHAAGFGNRVKILKKTINANNNVAFNGHSNMTVAAA
jgi:hypothetical protein